MGPMGSQSSPFPCTPLVTSKNVIVSCTFFVFEQCVGQACKVHETTTLLIVTLPNIHRLQKNHSRLSNKPYITGLSTTPLHLQCVATLPCNLSLMACFADINVSQATVATYASCSGTFDIHLTTNLPRNVPVKNQNRLRFERIIVMSLWPRFFGPPCGCRLHLQALYIKMDFKNLSNLL